MKRLLKIVPADPTPIWRQIEDGVRRLVASGALAAGAPLMSVRELARELVVNPATVQKAYQQLADAGVLVVRRGEGTFVAERPPALGRGELGRILREAATRYAGVAATLGATREQAIDAVHAAFSGNARAAGASGAGGTDR
jgi:GntR family transcriptional regulator